MKLAPELYSKDSERILQNFEISKQCDMFSLGCILLEMLTNAPLLLNSKYCNSEEIEDKPNTVYFSNNGIYFHQAVNTQYLQHKLHHAIRMQINKSVDSSFGINILLSRVIITMIQQNPNLRGNCAMFIQIIQALIEHCSSNQNNEPPSLPDFLTKNLLDFNKNIVTLLKEENLQLKNRNEELESELEKLRLELVILRENK